MSALAHAIGTSGYSTAARSTQPQVASSNSPLTVSQSMPASPGMAIARADDHAGEDADVGPGESLDLERLDLVGAGGGGRLVREAP